MKPADREAADRFEIILQRGIPALRRLRPEARIVDRERLRRLVDRLVREQIGQRRATKTVRPTQPRFEVRQKVAREMHARKRLRVAARDFTPGIGVVALRGADRIGRLLRRGAPNARPHPAPAVVLGFLGAHAGDKSRAAPRALRHQVAGRDGLGDFTRADKFLALCKIDVVAPQSGIDRCAANADRIGVPRRNFQPRLAVAIGQDRRIRGQLR